MTERSLPAAALPERHLALPPTAYDTVYARRRGTSVSRLVADYYFEGATLGVDSPEELEAALAAQDASDDEAGQSTES